MKLPTLFADTLQRLSNLSSPRRRPQQSSNPNPSHASRLQQRLGLFKPTPWQDMVNTMMPATGDAFDDRRVPRNEQGSATMQHRQKTNLHIVHAKPPTATAIPFELSLEQAMTILRDVPSTAAHNDLDAQHRAFMRIHSHLQQAKFTHDPTDAMPLVMLLASRLGHLADPIQQTLAMNIIAQCTQALPHIELVELLTTQLGVLPPRHLQRALDLIENFLQITVDIPLSQIDILLGLTDAITIDECRRRAGLLIATGLKKLHAYPDLCAEIRRRLTLSYCAVEQGLQLQV